ncbi:hypothetical protein AALP_AAs55710U000100 [Arabis alpina]|uniref:PUM-HD domain-containing protein n=1 Tax=Arabis alpina TaxID=50452 RepID=A0A087G284_ARAAL|nr:hypothetical protein AALP_AAs55710U000100 [Arabis alpina]
MLDALPKLRLTTAKEPRGVSTTMPPPGYTLPPTQETNDVTKQNQPQIHPCPCGLCAAHRQELEYRLQWIFDFMTNTKQDSNQFKETISKLNRGELQRIASLMTSDSDCFMAIARNEQGSKRMQKLLGKTDDVDGLFYAVIVRLFPTVMTDKNASHVAVRAMRVFDGVKKDYMCQLILHHALGLASDQHGCVAFNEILTDLDHPYYRNELLEVVVHNALSLSNDAYGNFVIQHVLKLNDLYCTNTIAIRLRGHCADLSLRKHGSYIVERLLEAEESMVLVVEDLLECEKDKLMRLARSDCGNFVVAKALTITKVSRVDLFMGLVHKLMPFVGLLRKPYRGSNIAAILDSVW